ncbi:hypothetical protein ONE63_005128 [Megalurothrips usitatus]|uniref:Cytochrome P450 n=1 Tax=Megalurothrips usitatus TaxID=439358 RepID=A0AAV7XYD6_9NEOP|nr:hypothetical protein ONE63_005128 [Megalurothrips usitatus]
MLAALAAVTPAVGLREVLLAATALLIVSFYFKTTDFWSRRGILQVKGLPIVGSSLRFYLQTEYRGHILQRFYTQAREKGEPCVGIYVGTSPVLVAVDQDLIRAVMVKDFPHFMGRGVPFDRKNEPLTANLFNIEGNEWRSLRHKLTPTFTSGRMRAMFPLVSACAEEMAAVLRAEAASGEPVSMLDLIARYTTDVIGTCAFGIQANALKDPRSEFRVLGKAAVNFSHLHTFFINVMPHAVPVAKKYFNVGLMDKAVSKFFTRVFQENFEFRQRSNALRHDFVDLLLQIKTKGKLDGGDEKDSAGKIDDDIIPAQAFIFFLAGFETSSGTLGNTMTELAHNPDVQDKARAEVQRVLANHGGQITYEALHDLTYLEQVIEETMRLYPAGSHMARVVTEDYALPIPTEKPAVLPKGMRVFIPTFAIHRDPEFYPEPDKFDPDNFTAEAKRARPNYAYIPFGEGPRICIGLRFAMMEMKVALATVLRGFRVEPAPGNKDYPPRFRPQPFITQTCGGNIVHLLPL